MKISSGQKKTFEYWRKDWCAFAKDVLHANLDEEQKSILRAVQTEKMVAVSSGTARGKDYIAAVAALCFFYLTPKWDKNHRLVENTKIALTAPCYDEETEILTEGGWKFFRYISFEDKVAQRGENGEIEFVHPTDVINEPYVGEMYGCKTEHVDFLVTPEHRCLFSNSIVSYENALRISSEYEKKKIENNGKYSQYDFADYIGKPQSYISKCLNVAKFHDGFAGEVRKAKEIYGKNGAFAKKALYKNGDIQNKDYMEFLGFWFAEGSTTFDKKNRKYRIAVTQKKGHLAGYVDDLINRVQPLFKNKFHKYSRQDGGFNWELYDKDVAIKFLSYGKQLDRKIPKWAKNSDVESMKAFIHGFFVGDGSKDKNGYIKLCVSSEQLADDLHEMCVKVGYIASKKKYKRKSLIKDICRHKAKLSSVYYYEVKLCTKVGEYPIVSKKDWYKTDYIGVVHCVTVPSGMVMVRRNGYNMWSGNTGRQCTNIMIPEVSRLFRNARVLPGRMLSDGIRTNNAEWFLTAFKASDDNTEAWSGFHAVNTMFVVTEASGVNETTFNAIEGNLQGNSRLLLVFNPNVTTGYAAKAMKSSRFKKFRLNSLDAENVVKKKNVIPGQVDYEWVKDKVDNWCSVIQEEYFDEGEGDFKWEGLYYRPNDLFRVKVLGLFPKATEDTLIPMYWLELAHKRWEKLQSEKFVSRKHPLIGIDVAGMGRDSSCFVPRYGNYVPEIKIHQSGGKADHMKVAGEAVQWLRDKKAKAFIDTIGEGAGVYARLEELGYRNAYSCKFSEGTKGLHDITGQYEFANMRAYCYWAVRDWLNPKNGFNPALPPCDELDAELTEVHWSFQSSGRIIIEPKEDLKQRLKGSPDRADALASTFYPRAKDYVYDSWILQNVL